MSSAANRGGVSGPQRYRRGLECPICGGSEDDDRGTGNRCYGFLGGDGKFAHCTREEKAGGLPMNANSSTFAHKLKGDCKCGVEHAPAEPRARKPRKPQAEVVAEYNYCDEHGVLLFQVQRKKDKTFPQRRPGGMPGVWIWNIEGVRRVLYRLPELLAADPGEPVFVVEGEKDVDNLRAVGLVATCNPMGAQGDGKWRPEYNASLAGRVVYIIADNDDVGRAHASKVARSLAGIAREVKALDLSRACRELDLGELPEKGDASDFLKLGGTADALKQIFHEAEPVHRLKVVGDDNRGSEPPREGQATSDRPLIVCGSEHPDEGLKTWTPQALDALAATNRPKPSVFQRNGELCRLKVPVDLDDSPSIETLGFDALRGVMDRSASWGSVHITKKGPAIRFGPPKVEIVKDVMALGSFDPEKFPALESIAESPVFAPDGRLIVESGYHPEARLYYSPSPDLRGLGIPERPSASEVRAAVSLLVDDLLYDFPFRNQASRANALAVMLLPFVRLMISGPTPNHHFTASTEGTGKGLCAAACAYPFLGRELAINAQKESEAEWRKALTSFLMSGGSHYFVDNLRNPVGWDDVPQDIESGVLAAAWTGIHWNDRILGGQDEARIKLHAVFMSSGNNVAFSRELTRRLVQVELVAVSENPSTRTGFKHGELKEWIRENRLALTRACLVLCRNWIAGGRIQGDQVMGSYESYARTMGGILAAAGISGFLENRPKVGKDRESQRWPALVVAWHKDRAEMATSSQMIYDLIFGFPTKGGRTGGIPELQVAFADVVGDGKELSRKQKLGHAIGKQDGRVWAGWRVVRTGASTNNGSALYRLANPDEPDDAESSDEWSEDRE